MALTVHMSPEAGGRLVLDGFTYDPRVPYTPGEVVRIKVLPAAGYQFAGWSGDVPAGHGDDVPLEVTIGEAPQDIVAHFAPVSKDASELVFDANFENGNGILRYLYRDSRRLVVEPLQVKAANNIWWHFKIHGIVPGEFLVLNVVHCPIAGDSQPVYSYDGVTWQRFTSTRAPYVQKFTAPSVEIARNIPYSYSRTLTLAAEMRGPQVQVQNLAVSEEGRPIKMFRFTDPDEPDTDKRVIWIMARQHAFESHSSWYAEGLARWLLGNHALAAALRRQAIVYVVPMMDVDNVYHGGAGKEQLNALGERVDLNRSWGPNSPWTVIRAAQALLGTLKATHDIAAFIDLHNPWYPDPPHWHIRHTFGTQVTTFAELWSSELAATGSDVQWKHWLRVKAPDQSEDIEPTPGMLTATEYAEQALFSQYEDHLCFTIETPHWHDGYGNPITLASLRAYGEALGRSLARFLGASESE